MSPTDDSWPPDPGTSSQQTYPGEAPPQLPPAFEAPQTLERVPWRWWEPIVVFLFTLVSASVVGLLATLVLTVGADCSGDAAPGRCDVADSVFIAIFELALGAWALLWVKVRFNAGPKILGLSVERLRSNIGVGVVAGVIGFVAGPVIIGSIAQLIANSISTGPVDAPKQLPFEGTPHWLALVITGISVVVLAPIAEELFFRGFLFQGLRRKLSFVPAGIVSALIFGAAHVQPGSVLGLLLLIPAITALGFILAWVFERRASLVPPIAAHALFNVVGFSIYLGTLAAD